MIIKICGMREAANIRAVEALHPDWMGFIFWPKSSRRVSEKPTYLPTKCKRVGVFVDADIETVKQTADNYALDIIQLHGHESPEYVAQLHEWKVIKAINIGTAEDLEQTREYEGHVDSFLFDTRAPVPAASPAGSPAGSVPPGGTGVHFDWTVLADYVGETPFLLSGGIGPDDAERVLAFHHEKCIGIDLNSRFETAPGLKDVHKLKEFIKKIRQ